MATEHKYRTKNGTETKLLSPMKAIRKKCLDCCGWSATEVTECTSMLCPLYPFRLGKDPGRKKLSEERRKQMSASFKNRILG